MPLLNGGSQKTIDKNVSELLVTWKRNGYIGNSKPATEAAARRQAVAIAMDKAGKARKTRNKKDSNKKVNNKAGKAKSKPKVAKVKSKPKVTKAKKPLPTLPMSPPGMLNTMPPGMLPPRMGGY